MRSLPAAGGPHADRRRFTNGSRARGPNPSSRADRMRPTLVHSLLALRGVGMGQVIAQGTASLSTRGPTTPNAVIVCLSRLAPCVCPRRRLIPLLGDLCKTPRAAASGPAAPPGLNRRVACSHLYPVGARAPSAAPAPSPRGEGWGEESSGQPTPKRPALCDHGHERRAGQAAAPAHAGEESPHFTERGSG